MTDSKQSLAVNATRDLAGFAARLEFQDIPPEAVARAKQCVLDAIGCCLFGVTLPWTRLVQGMAEKEGGNAIASIFGSGKKTAISLAVLVNSTAGHAFELDDMHMGSSHHLPARQAGAMCSRPLWPDTKWVPGSAMLPQPVYFCVDFIRKARTAHLWRQQRLGACWVLIRRRCSMPWALPGRRLAA